MASTFLKNIRYILLAWVLLLQAASNAYAQTYPEIPSSVSFGGITVKFDRSAQNLIEEDVKSLMSNKKFWEEKMDRAVLHFPIVEGIFMDEEVPIDFKYLAVQESSFRPDVVSTSNAVGYWQFKPETARELNLRVDSDIDERKNISSSTHAAAWYLKKNNQQFNNWVTTLYSYYQGAGGVKKIIPANWAYAREVTLNGKTDRYMLRFFAHKIALEAGIERYKTANQTILLESDYGKGLSFDEIASSLGIASADLKAYNKWINANEKIPSDREYLIAIPVPVNQVASVREKLSLPERQTVVASVFEDTGFPIVKKAARQLSETNAPILYEINGLPGVEARAGDKPKTLAKAGDIKAPTFMRYNDMLAEMPLIPGKIYYLSKKNKKAATPFHTARPGDTWHSVSQQYGLRLVSLLKYNRTTSRNYPIQTGQVLFLTKKRPRKQPIEIIGPPQPAPAATEPTVASAPQTAPATAAAPTQPNTIPDKPSGRKKYTPVLVEKSESSVAKETAPAATPTVTAPMAVVPKVEIPVATSKPSSNNTETNDRVVIITQDNADSFRSAEEEKPAAKPAKPAATATTGGSTATMSVYQRQRLAAQERAAKEAAEQPQAPEIASTAEKISYHTVQPGETYFSISNKYNLTVRELIALNSKSGGPNRLVSGQRLLVSKSESAAEENAAKPIPVTRPAAASTFKTPEEIKQEMRSSAYEGQEFHVVQGGETYYSICRAYGLNIKDLYAMNNLDDSDKLKSGQRLRIKKSGGNDDFARPDSQKSATSGTQTHTVAPGETLFRIAQNYQTSVEDLKKLNNMSGNSVMVGQKLKIPQQ
jgi:membrane-bound lytic murein transglycosylase D